MTCYSLFKSGLDINTKERPFDMTDQELKKLSRNDLLELLLDQAKEIQRLQTELEEANQKLADRRIKLDKAGSIAEAALQINDVFNAAQEACAQYMYNITELSQRQEAICAKMEEETQKKCEKMLTDAQQRADAYWNNVCRKVDSLLNNR